MPIEYPKIKAEELDPKWVFRPTNYRPTVVRHCKMTRHHK